MKSTSTLLLFIFINILVFGQNNSWSSSSGDGSAKDSIQNVDTKENKGFGELGYNLHFAMPIGNFFNNGSGNGYPFFTAHEFKYNYHWDAGGNVLPFIGGNILLSTNNKSQIDLPAGDYHLNNRLYSYHFKIGFLFTNDYNKTSPYIYGFYGNMTHRIRDELFVPNEFGFAESVPGSTSEISRISSNSYGLALGLKSELNKFLILDFGVMWMQGNRGINYLNRDLDLRTIPDPNILGGERLEYNTGFSRLNMITLSIGLAFKFSSSGRSSGRSYYTPNNYQYNSPSHNRWWGSGFGGGVYYDRWGNPVNHWGTPNQWGNPYYNPNQNFYNQPRTNFPSSGSSGSSTGSGKSGSGGGSIQYDGKTPIGRK